MTEPPRKKRAPDPDQSDLWVAWIEHGDREARATLIETNLIYVRRVVGKMVRYLPPHVDHDDVASSGKIGLIRAVDHFDPQRGAPFSNYAVASIRGTILDELRVIDWAPRSLRKRAREVMHAREDLQIEYGRSVTDEEIGERLGRDGHYVRQVAMEVRHSTFKSLHEAGPNGETGLLDMPDTGPEPEDRAALSATQAQITEWLQHLSPESQKVIALYYYWEMTFAEMAQATGIPISRISQLHNALILEMGQIIRTALTDLRSS